MQITFDTSTATRTELRLLDVLITMLKERFDGDAKEKTVPAPPVIAPADNPSTGVDTLALFAATAPAAPSAVPAIDRDSEGYPWDARIHSSTKKKTDAGVWQLRKGINNDKATLERVRAELKATAALPVSASAQVSNVAPLFPQAQAAAPAVTLPSAPVLPASLPALPTTPSLPALPPPVVQPDPTTVAELMMRVGPSLATLKMPPTAIQEACTKLGIPSLEALVSANRPDLVLMVWKELQPLTA